MPTNSTQKLSADSALPEDNRLFIGKDTDLLWYKDAVIYQVHVKSFFDFNNDGIGDFEGLISKLDYIAQLGVNTIWLLPFYPSPRRDDGYDIAEYNNVHADYGSMDDARRFVSEAHKRGLRVITELVINHTSDQHPWFQRARAAEPDSDERNFYVWSDNNEAYAGTRIIFVDSEKSNWTWDPVAKSYFWHRFYSHQPDLNFDNPAVLEAVLDVMSFWLNIGIDGLRLDAVPYLIEREGTSNENLPETHVILKKIRAHLDQHFTGRMLLAEANMWPEDVQPYFGDDGKGNGDECHMAFHFPLMPRIYMALAQQDRFPITDILRQTPEIPADCQWAIFLRNHDELTLEMVTDRERDYLWNYYAADRRARINLGIRRRLAPLLQRDRRRIELLNSLLLSMPGTPVLYYGDEIGMGDNIHLGDRDGVRTPMQWSPDRNGGFSRADPATMVLPPVMDALYGYQAINVEAQSSDPYSLLNWMRRLLEVRAKHRAFGRGSYRMIYPSNRKILAYLREYKDESKAESKSELENGERAQASPQNQNQSQNHGETILCVANVGNSSEAVELDLSAFDGMVPLEMLGGAIFPVITKKNYVLTLPPFGFYWFVLTGKNQVSGVVNIPETELLPDHITLVLRNGLSDLVTGSAKTILERDILPYYLPLRRWYSGKQSKINSVNIVCTTVLPEADASAINTANTNANINSTNTSNVVPMLLAEIETTTDEGTNRFLVPLGFESEAASSSSAALQFALARVRRERRVGLLTDAFALDSFALHMLELIRTNARFDADCGEIVCRNFGGDLLSLKEPVSVRRISSEQSNSSLILGEQIVLKVLRRLSEGLHPELEMSRYLSERGYRNTPPILGEVTRHYKKKHGGDDDFNAQVSGEQTTLILLQEFVHNQGDAWRWTLNTLVRAIHEIDATPAPVSKHTEEPLKLPSGPLQELEDFAKTLGQRLAQLHATLAQPSDDAAFSPEHANDADVSHWLTHVLNQLDAAFEIIEHSDRWNEASDSVQGLVRTLLQQRAALEQKLKAIASDIHGALRIRIHGDFHLGQVLVSSGDAFLIDFEGEPSLNLAERRAKNSPWRDVAGLLRSIDYAAAFADDQGPGAVGPNDLSERVKEAKASLIQDYVRLSQTAFLRAYIAEAPEGNHASGTALLHLFTLEKAAYELCYEAANRPDWMEVPLRGLSTLTESLIKQ